MSGVVDILITSFKAVGSSGDPPAFLFFARGASTAGVSSSFVVSSVRRFPAFGVEQKGPSWRGAVFLILLVLTYVGSAANSASPLLSLSHPLLYLPWRLRPFSSLGAQNGHLPGTCHCHWSLPLLNGPRDALSARVPIRLRPCSSPGSSCSGSVVTRANMASSPL